MSKTLFDKIWEKHIVKKIFTRITNISRVIANYNFGLKEMVRAASGFGEKVYVSMDQRLNWQLALLAINGEPSIGL